MALNTDLMSLLLPIKFDCTLFANIHASLQWRHNGRDSVSNHQPHDCLLNCLFRRRWKKTSKLRVTGLCVGNSPVTGEFPSQMVSNAENVAIWWRHHAQWPCHGALSMGENKPTYDNETGELPTSHPSKNCCLMTVTQYAYYAICPT